ncbi:MAG TPA: transposase [Edaphobacter sp.]|nr:transposase [Edaphobacter sp.]
MRANRAEEWTRWRGWVSDQRQSGQNVAIFCREHGLREWQFYAWKKRVREGEAARFVEVQVKSTGKVAEAKPAVGGAIEIRLSKGRSLVVEPGFDTSHLQALLAALETEA